MAAIPMTEAELDRLETLLDSHPPGLDPLWIDSLQGFLAACISAPEPVSRDRWMAVAVGKEDGWDTDPQSQELVRLVDRLYADVLRDLGEGEGIPLLVYPKDESGDEYDFEPWVAGYLEGVELADPAWYDAGEEEVVDELLFPFVALSGGLEEDDEIVEMLTEDGATREEVILRCQEELPLVVQNAFDYWFEKRKPDTVKRDAPKVGRNDPCPCGSGKKYKACCGAG
ncbi:MAG: UPF0149 family protein [Betaproteobacteria bacterium]|nr:UPF0149 family protein [Betaproteobacteria bacterium]MBL8533058.1 UPF0149 family protein [Betaproteobacteria bacterium]